MSDVWAEYLLKDICDLIVDCPHSTPDWKDSGVLVIRNYNIKSGRLDLSDPSYVSEEEYILRTKRAVPSEDDVILTREAPMGEVCIIPKDTPCCLGQRVVLLRPNKTLVYAKYLLYVLQSPYLQYQIKWSEGTGTTVSNLRIPHIEQLKIPLPSLEVQKKIADTLSSLDTKIELNTRINKVLEEIAQILFKHWFVDFEFPDVNGKPYKSSGGRMVESDMGMIPEGWDVGILEDLVERKRNLIEPQALNILTNYIGLEHIPRHHLVLDKWGESDSVTSTKSLFSKGDILFGTLRPYFHKVGISPIEGVCSTDILVLQNKKIGWDSYLLCIVSSDTFVAYSNSAADGTKMPRAKWSYMKKYLVALPQETTIFAFEKLIEPILMKITDGILENMKLSKTRDTLLPKLMKGDIKL